MEELPLLGTISPVCNTRLDIIASFIEKSFRWNNLFA